MSKQGKRRFTVDQSKSKDLTNRPSVFQRLGAKKSVASADYCRQWAQSGNCAYGKNCKFVASHTLISPSKQRAFKDSDHKQFEQDVYVIRSRKELHSTVLVKPGHSPGGDIDKWDQNDLEFVDTDVLEKRRQQLQRELELQIKMDSGKNTRTKDKKKVITSSSSSQSPSSSSVSSSSSNDSTDSSSDRDTKKKNKKGKRKRNSSSSPENKSAKKKLVKNSSTKQNKNAYKKKDTNSTKRNNINKKKVFDKNTLSKNALSPGKKSAGTPPISSKNFSKTTQHSKSPHKKEKVKSVSPHSAKERDHIKMKEKNRSRARSRSKKLRSRSPHRHASDSRDVKRKESLDKTRAISPRKLSRLDGNNDKHRRRSLSKEKTRDNKDKSIERRKEKIDDKKNRGRDRSKDLKREDSKKRGRGLGNRGSDKGLEKPNKPMERLLPRPEERLAALAAISNKLNENDKGSSKDRQDRSSEKGVRKDKDRVSRKGRMGSIDRERINRESLERTYDSRRGDHYDKKDIRYSSVSRDPSRSPTYSLVNRDRDRHYESYDMPGPPRAYQENERLYDNHTGFDDQHGRTWEGRSGSTNRDHTYESRKNWDNDEYRNSGDWARDRHWSVHDPQMEEWGSKESGVGRWHHRGHPSSHRGRMHDEYVHARMDKRHSNQSESEPTNEILATQAAGSSFCKDREINDKPIPDDLSEISDDPDDILNRDDMMDQNYDDDSQTAQTSEVVSIKFEEKESTQDTSAAGEKDSNYIKDDEDLTNMDFEEISDGELEEEKARAGIGDALGVDWASLVADVRRRSQPTPAGGARDRWRPEAVLSRIGLSFSLAGKHTVQNILETSQRTETAGSSQNGEGRGDKKQNADLEKFDAKSVIGVDDLHPVAAIQVAKEKRKRLRAALFGTGCDIARALSARRDLALRRHLCNLPVTERSAQLRVSPSHNLFQAARQLLLQAPVAV